MFYCNIWHTLSVLLGQARSYRAEQLTPKTHALSPNLYHMTPGVGQCRSSHITYIVWTDDHFGSETFDGHFGSTTRTKTVATRHVSLPRNIPKCFCSLVPPVPYWRPLSCTSWQRGKRRDKKREGREVKGRLRKRRERFAQKGWASSALPEMRLPRRQRWQLEWQCGCIRL